MNGAKPEEPDLRRPSLLVVEDDPLQRAVASDHFRSRGYRVFDAGTAVEAAEILRAVESVDVVFADINLPGVMGGLSLTVWLQERYPGIPVVLTSGVRAISPNLADRVPFVPKPYSFEELDSLFGRIINMRTNKR